MSESKPTVLLTVPEVAQRLAISRAQIYSLKATGELKFVKIGRSTRFREADVEAFIDRCLVV
jgi:excisionase family DNA binding protein